MSHDDEISCVKRSQGAPGTWAAPDWAALLAVVLLSAGVFLTDLGRIGFWSRAEGRVAEIAREMIETGDYLLPRINNQLDLTKPPFVHWCVAGAFHFLGYSETAARFPVALMLALSCAAIFLLVRRVLGSFAGLLAAAFLATSPDYVLMGRSARVDGPLAFLALLSIALLTWAFISSSNAKRCLLALAAGVAAGAAVLAKGPVGVIVPALAAGGFLLAKGVKKQGKARSVLLALVACIATALPWYVAAAWKAPAEDRHFFFFGQLVKWTSGDQTSIGERLVTLPQYLCYLAKGFFPWSLLLPAAFIAAWRDLRDASTRPETKAAIAMFSMWFWGTLLLLSLSGTRAARYIVPVYPAAAFFVAYGVKRLGALADARILRYAFVAGSSIVCLVFLLVQALQTLAAPMSAEGIARMFGAEFGADGVPLNHAAVASLALLPVRWVLFPIGVFILAASLVSMIAFAKRKAALGAALLMLSAFGVIFCYNHVMAPRLDLYNSPKAFAEACRERMERDTRLFWRGYSLKALHFYLGRNFRIPPKADDLGLWERLYLSLEEPGAMAIVVTEERTPIERKRLDNVRILEAGYCQFRYLYLVRKRRQGDGASSRPGR